jgi:hypothetical protein
MYEPQPQQQQPINDWYPPDSRGWQLHSQGQFFSKNGKSISLVDEVLPPEIPGNLRRKITAEPLNQAEQYSWVNPHDQYVHACTPANLDRIFSERGAKNSAFAEKIYDSYKSGVKNPEGRDAAAYNKSAAAYKRWCNIFADEATEQGRLLESLAGLGDRDKILALSSSTKNESRKNSAAARMVKESTMGAIAHNGEIMSTYKRLIDKSDFVVHTRSTYKSAANKLEKESNGKNKYLEDYLPTRPYNDNEGAEVRIAVNSINHVAQHGVLPASDKKRKAPTSDAFAQLCAYMNEKEGLNLDPAACVPQLKEEFTLGQEVRKETQILFLDRSSF